MDSRYIAFGMFGVALAILCWRVSAVQNMRNMPANIDTDDVPETPVPLIVADPADVVGMSYLPGPPVNVPSYRANVPFMRPDLPRPPRVAL